MPGDERGDSYWRLIAHVDGDAAFLINLLALLPYAVSTRHRSPPPVSIPVPRLPFDRAHRYPDAVVPLWPQRKGVRHPPSTGGPS